MHSLEYNDIENKKRGEDRVMQKWGRLAHYIKRIISEIDYITILISILLMSIGLLLLTTTSAASTNRIGIADHFHFFYKQLIFIITGIIITFVFAFIDNKYMKIICIIGFYISFILLIAVLFMGEVANGAKRWINIYGFSLQPAEMLKPFYVVFIANKLQSNYSFPRLIAFHMILTGIILVQPDFGMAFTITTIFILQIFCSPIPIKNLLYTVTPFITIFPIIAYSIFPHVRKRVTSFFDPNVDNLSAGYQAAKSMLSYIKGRWLGCGLGEGKIKYQLPDSHTDYIFAVAAEELGAILCMFIIFLYTTIVIRGFLSASHSQSQFNTSVIIGIIGYIALQSAFNISVTLSILPSKGMILPFISYGGSAMIAMSTCLGIYINCSRKRSTKIEFNSNVHL